MMGITLTRLYSSHGGLPEKVALNNSIEGGERGSQGISRERMGQVTRVAGAKRALGGENSLGLKEQQGLQCGWGNVGEELEVTSEG